MTAKSFVRAVKKRTAPEDEPKPLTLDLTTYEADEEGEPLFNSAGEQILDPETGEQVIGVISKQTVLHATKPSDDAMLISYIQAGREDASDADKGALILDLFKAALPAEEYRQILRRVKDSADELDVDMLMDAFDWLQEQWEEETGFPTGSPSASSGRQQRSGKSSTGRSPGKTSTRSR